MRLFLSLPDFEKLFANVLMIPGLKESRLIFKMEFARKLVLKIENCSDHREQHPWNLGWKRWILSFVHESFKNCFAILSWLVFADDLTDVIIRMTQARCNLNGSCSVQKMEAFRKLFGKVVYVLKSANWIPKEDLTSFVKISFALHYSADTFWTMHQCYVSFTVVSLCTFLHFYSCQQICFVL